MKHLIVTMPDGTRWAVPVDVIARDRAAYFAKEFDGDVDASLAQDTAPLFDDDPYEVHDWAANNMNWSDVREHARKISEAPEADYDEGWCNGKWQVREMEAP